MRFHSTYWWAVLGCGVAGCSAPRETPTSELRDLIVDRTIDEDSLTTSAPTRPPMQLVLAESEYRFGASSKSEGEELGVVDFGVVLDDGRVVISDLTKHRLAYLAKSGELLSLFGRAGEGPGEIGQASGLYLRADGRIVLRDAQHQRATVLKPDATTLTLNNSYRVDSYARQICSVGTRTVGIRYKAQRQRTLELMAEGGNDVSYIGLPLVRATHEENLIWTNGSLLCLPEQARVIFAAQTGDLIAYRLDGSIAWRRRIAGFLPSQVKVVGGGTLLTAAPPPLNRSATVRSLVRLDSVTGLLQMVLLVRNGPGKTSTVERVGIDSRIIDLGSGAELGKQTNLPLMIDARNGMALTYSEEPEPAVSLVRFYLTPRLH